MAHVTIARTAYSMQYLTLDQAVVILRFDSTTGKLHIAAVEFSTQLQRSSSIAAVATVHSHVRMQA